MNKIVKKSNKKDFDEEKPIQPSKPQGVFFIFKRFIIEDLKKEYPQEKEQQLIKRASEEWKNLSKTKSKKFEEMYNQELMQYQAKLEEYQVQLAVWKEENQYRSPKLKSHLEQDSFTENQTPSKKGVKKSKKAEDKSNAKAFKSSENCTRKKSQAHNQLDSDLIEVNLSQSKNYDKDSVVNMRQDNLNSYDVAQISKDFDLWNRNFKLDQNDQQYEQLWCEKGLNQLKLKNQFFLNRNSSFEIVRNLSQFVDRSLLISTLILKQESPYLIIHPRRTGKSTNIQMLKDFFSLQLKNNGKVNNDRAQKMESLFFGEDNFPPLKISSVKNIKLHFGKYPTLFISLKNIVVKNIDELINALKCQVQLQFRDHEYLTSSIGANLDLFNLYFNNKLEKHHIFLGLPFLIKLLNQKHNQKVLILVDEYDKVFSSLISEDSQDYLFIQEAAKIISGFLLSFCKIETNEVFMVVMTGIYDFLLKEEIGLNNVKVLDVLSDYVEGYYGLAQQELISKLLFTFHFNSQEQLFSLMSYIKYYYNGYYGKKERYYNIWSIYNFLCKASNESEQGNSISLPKGYWVENSELLIYFLQNSVSLSIKQKIIELIQGKSVELEDEETISLEKPYKIHGEKKIEKYFMRILISGGYITKDRDNFFQLPNKEILKKFKNLVEEYLREYVKNLFPLLQAIYNRNVEKIESELKTIFLENVSYYDVPIGDDLLKSEINYHNLILGLLVSRDPEYLIQSNKEAGKGRCDIMLLPKDSSKPGFIIEFKVLKKQKTDLSLEDQLLKKAEKGLNQVLNKSYHSLMNLNRVKQCVIYSIAFHKKELKVKYLTKILENEN